MYAIKKEEFYLREIMTSFSDFVITCQRKGYLDSWTIQMFGAIGRHASKFYVKNNVANITIKFIVGTLNLMKNEIESNQLPAQAVNYEAIKKQLESQKEFLLRNNLNLVDPILNEIQVILDGFKSVNKHSDNNIVKWAD